MTARTMIIASIPTATGAIIGSAKWGWVGGLVGTAIGLTVGLTVAKLTKRGQPVEAPSAPIPPKEEMPRCPNCKAITVNGMCLHCGPAFKTNKPSMQDSVANAQWSKSDLFPTRPPLC